MDTNSLIDTVKRVVFLFGAEVVEDLGEKSALVLRDMAVNNTTFADAWKKVYPVGKTTIEVEAEEIPEVEEDEDNDSPSELDGKGSTL